MLTKVSVTWFCIEHIDHSVEAVRGQHTDIVHFLASAGCNVNLPERETQYAPIHTAVRIGKLHILQMSLSTEDYMWSEIS